MASRFNEIMHGDPATLQEMLSNGDLDTEELCAAMQNLCGQIMRIDTALRLLAVDCDELAKLRKFAEYIEETGFNG